MVNTLINPAVNPGSRLGAQPFDETSPICFLPMASASELETVIRAIYRQVLGNAYVMESERLRSLESQLAQGILTVREFVRQLAKSELYRTRFFENCPRYRALELNFKHLLGRAPESYQETTFHSHILDTEGYDADIDAYLDSDEYQTAFGEHTVPYYRGDKTQTGKALVGFTHMSQLWRGSSASDKDLTAGNPARVMSAILTNRPSPIQPPSNISPDWCPPSDVKTIIAKALGVKTRAANVVGQPPSVALTSQDTNRQEQYQGLQALNIDAVELCPGFSNEDAEIVIRAIYRQVLGNAYVMESERLQVPESQLKRGELSVREFIRCLAKSELYRTRFFDDCYRYRAIELNFKHLLGRAPSSFEEMKYHSSILDEAGFEADIDAYLNSDEYQQTFGEFVVPYYRGYKTQTGQPLIGFTNMLQLLPSASSSDKDLTAGNPSQLTRSLILNRPYGIDRPRDAKDILRDVFKPKVAVVDRVQQTKARAKQVAAEQALKQRLQQQAQEIERLQQQLSELRPLATVGATYLKNSWSPSAAASGSESSTSLQQQSDGQAAQMAALQAQIADARRYAVIGAARTNKWQSRRFNG